MSEQWYLASRVTLSDSVIETGKEDEHFMFRLLLGGISIGCWSALYGRGRTKVDIVMACEFLEDEYKGLLACNRIMKSQDEEEEEQDRPHETLWGWVNNDGWVSDSSDIHDLIEYADEDWLASIPRNEMNANGWQWDEVELLLALIAIDRAILNLEHAAQTHPKSKTCFYLYAAKWASRAAESHGLAKISSHWQSELSITGKLGADVRWKDSRAAHKKAIELYDAESWKNPHAAAKDIWLEVRKICPKLNKGTVYKWLLKHDEKKAARADQPQNATASPPSSASTIPSWLEPKSTGTAA